MGIREASNGLLENFERHGISLTSIRKKDQEIFRKYDELKEFIKEIDSGEALKDFMKQKIDLKNSENVKLLV